MNPKNGGPSQGIRNINPHIRKLGIEVEVVCMDNCMDNYDVNDDFVIHKIGQGRSSYQYHPPLFDWLKENALNFDVLIVHGLWQYHNLAVYRTIKFLKKKSRIVPKVVIIPHGMLDPYFQKDSDRKWKALRNEIVWQLIEKKCINLADAILFTCQEELRLAATTFKGYHPKKTINIGYGIQTPPQNSQEFKTAFEQKCITIQGNKYWLFLSRIHEKKGVDLLINAYCKLAVNKSTIPDLVIAGPIASNYAQEMIAMASKNSKIHFLGMLQGAEKWGAFYNCEAYLLPSHQENFGIAIVEAMACKKPVVISKNVNIWKEVQAGNGGWILNELNEAEIYNVLLAISYLSETQIIQKGVAAYETFQTNFNVQDRATVLVKVLNQL
ncbi:glycosyltransferase [Flavobacterium restrictum]|uniref:Glycosyltransferase n=2 Tax=Flavobacterium restrictum TaxID=2594428 RepID=A0A553E5B9_9FLAO|nr:glycosyltransferase [Flavobacterium restrictum]